MSFQSLSTIQKNKTFAPIILALAILLTFLWIFPSFTSYSDNSTSLDNIEKNYSNKKNEFEKLKEIELEVQNESWKNASFIKKVSREFESASILSALMLNNYTQPKLGVQSNAPVTITNIALDRGSKLPSGIYQWKITMTINSNNIDNIVDYLTHVTTNTNFAFTLGDITLPIDTLDINETEKISLPITLGLYYYP